MVMQALDQHLTSTCHAAPTVTTYNRQRPGCPHHWQANKSTEKHSCRVQIQSFQTMTLLPSCKKNCWPLRCLREASVRLSLEEKYIPARPQTTMRANKKAMVHCRWCTPCGDDTMAVSRDLSTPWQYGQ